MGHKFLKSLSHLVIIDSRRDLKCNLGFVVTKVAERIFAFLGAWNDYLGPLIYLANPDRFTLSLGLAMFNSQYGSFPSRLMAVTTVMTLPILVLFFLTQKTFIQGITVTGMKN